MFGFLKEWDAVLENYMDDIQSTIRSNPGMCPVAMQTYCERIFMLLNEREKIVPFNSNRSLGVYATDTEFCEVVRDRTGFGDLSSIRRLNDIANSRKHRGSTQKLPKEEIITWLKKVHILTEKTYNYLKLNDFHENFDQEEVEQLFISLEEKAEEKIEKQYDEIINYADDILERKNNLIKEILDEKASIIEECNNLKKENKNLRYKMETALLDSRDNNNYEKKIASERLSFYKMLEDKTNFFELVQKRKIYAQKQGIKARGFIMKVEPIFNDVRCQEEIIENNKILYEETDNLIWKAYDRISECDIIIKECNKIIKGFVNCGLGNNSKYYDYKKIEPSDQEIFANDSSLKAIILQLDIRTMDNNDFFSYDNATEISEMWKDIISENDVIKMLNSPSLDIEEDIIERQYEDAQNYTYSEADGIVKINLEHYEDTRNYSYNDEDGVDKMYLGYYEDDTDDYY